MLHNSLVNESQIDLWVRGNPELAQGLVVELVWRLVAAASPKPIECRFPLGDSQGQSGPDGELDAVVPFPPYVPVGRSVWEIGTGIDPGKKATDDYNDRTKATPEAIRLETESIFVTPLSGRRSWPNIWKEGSQAAWLDERRRRRDWRDVHVIDGTRLIAWLHHFPAVELWLAAKMGQPSDQIETPEQRWAILRTIGDPPPLIPAVFLGNRGDACAKLKDVFSGAALRLRLDTRFLSQAADFVAAFVADMDEGSKIAAIGRCLILKGTEAWSAVTSLREPHIVIADFDIDEMGLAGTRLLEMAKNGRHSVVFGGMPGGVPDPNRVSMPVPKSFQIEEALKKAGYKEERARSLAHKSDGNLGSLLRCIQNLSLLPEWAEGTEAAELAIAEILGSWRDDLPGDRKIAELMSKKAYGEWIDIMRNILRRPGTPLSQRDGVWKLVSRYEAWYSLGPRLFDDHLDRLRGLAVMVLREEDPKFELPPEDRFAATIHGKVPSYSQKLRSGLSETLALLACHSAALVSCSSGKSELSAALCVREILADASWIRWASLDDILPLLAEAAPMEFLDAVERALEVDVCPFIEIFAQEGGGATGSNYMTGLLWALETLAWSPDFLARVVVILGALAAKDPHLGHWANRPENSLSTILLPWLPQTVATLAQRRAAVSTLLKEFPDVGWRLVLVLFSGSQQSSGGSRRPAWREFIADDWSSGVTPSDYLQQVSDYAELAVDAAKKDISKLATIIKHLGQLPSASRRSLLTHLRSPQITSLNETERLVLWSELVDVLSTHRKFGDAQWSLNPDSLSEIAEIAEIISPKSPSLRHQRLFSERNFDLYEARDDFEEQDRRLDERRKDAVDEIFRDGGLEAVLQFASSVEVPWRVGYCAAAIETSDLEAHLLPALLEADDKSIAQFVGGLIWAKFDRDGWGWIDKIEMSTWTASQKGQFLAFLPFSPETWQRADQLLGCDESQYWTKTSANPYESKRELGVAADRLLKYGRPHAAIRCLEIMRFKEQAIDKNLAIRALRAVLDSPDGVQRMNRHAVVEVIEDLQEDADADVHDLLQIEWAFLPLLDRHEGSSPRLLERQLADDPAFFCEVIQSAFRSKKVAAPHENQSERETNVARNAYRLLNGWQTPPGSRKDGTYDGRALAEWLDQVKTSCAESGHLEIALTMVGHVLTHVPPDPDGLWLHNAAANELNAKDADDLRDGFSVQLFNSRGVYWSTGGMAERELAAKYRAQAADVDSRGYHRLAGTLRELAASYIRDAERQAKDESDDD